MKIKMSNKLFRREILFFFLNFIFWFAHWAVYLIIGYSRGFHPDLFYHSYQYFAPFLTTLLLRNIYKKNKMYSWHLSLIVILVIVSSILCGFIFWISRGVLNYFYLGVFNHDNFLKDIEPMWVSSYMFALWNVIYLGFKSFEESSIQKQNAERAAILAQGSQLEMLRYQLNPHFLFNTLSSLRALIRKKDDKTAEEMVTKISEFLKYSLLEGENNKVPLAKEIKTINHYFDIEKIRFGEQLEIEYNINPETEKFYIPVFLIHPIIENAVKHGMKTSPAPLTISVYTKMVNNNLLIEILNTGRWIERKAKDEISRTGLQNTRKRLQLAYPNEHTFLIIKKEDSVCVRIIINENSNR